jgi:hypothetical protein
MDVEERLDTFRNSVADVLLVPGRMQGEEGSLAVHGERLTQKSVMDIAFRDAVERGKRRLCKTGWHDVDIAIEAELEQAVNEGV